VLGNSSTVGRGSGTRVWNGAQWISHIAYSVGDAVQQAYQRTDLLEKRRRMMEDWSRYLNQTRKKYENIRPIKGPVNG